MAQITHNTSFPNDGLGDPLRTAFGNQNTMNTELYTNKVDKVLGKGLSSNDFTNEQVIKLQGIQAGAEVNVQPDWFQNDNTADNFIKNKPQQLFASIGFFHYADLATQTTPLSFVANTERLLTNDTLGLQTNLQNPPYGVTSVFSANKFNFSQLDIGDTLELRVDLKLTTTSVNQKYKVFLRVAGGTASAYDLPIFSGQVKTVLTDYQIVGEIGFSLNTIDHITANSELFIVSDDIGSVKVNGFYTRIIRRSVNIVNTTVIKPFQEFIFIKKGFNNILTIFEQGDVFEGWFAENIYSTHAVWDGVGSVTNPTSFEHKQFIEY